MEISKTGMYFKYFCFCWDEYFSFWRQPPEVKIARNDNAKDEDGHVTETFRDEADHVIGAGHVIDHAVDHVTGETVARHVSAVDHVITVGHVIVVGHVSAVGHVIDTGGEVGAEVEVVVEAEAIVKSVMDVTGIVTEIVTSIVITGNQRELKTLPRLLLS